MFGTSLIVVGGNGGIRYPVDRSYSFHLEYLLFSKAATNLSLFSTMLNCIYLCCVHYVVCLLMATSVYLRCGFLRSFPDMCEHLQNACHLWCMFYSGGRYLAHEVVSLNCCVEPYESSLLWFLWYLKSAGGSKRINFVPNGAQVTLLPNHCSM